ncbi:MAG: ABC transporter ATP-binding protein [Rhodobacteraceae bacterium]|nr:ABC transporter ATP-binding protein [Paracoccaceae bacterium]
MATLDLKNINKSFGATQVLFDIDLAIKDKEFVVFVGPSGCGKSTLLRIISGLEMATEGQIIINGEDVSEAHPVDRGISMVFQSYALYPHLTVYENIAFPLRVQKASKEEIETKVMEAAEILKLVDRLQFKPGALSGGQRQRVAIGRSIVRKPKIFLFDEPLSNLDAALRGDMRVELSTLHKDLDATMVYVTHDQIEAMTMADRIVVLNGGVVEQFDTPMMLYHQPINKFVAAFIGQPSMNFIGAVVTGISDSGLAMRLEGDVNMVLPVATEGMKIGDLVEVGIRPEHVHYAPENGILNITIDILERLGGSSITYGPVAGCKKFCAALDGEAPITEGQTVPLGVDPADCHVFKMDGTALTRQKIPTLV